jgi:nucleoside-diphosphate-sugar epimerase
MTQQILVTGHTGFVGRALTPVLESAGYSVVGASTSSGGTLDQHMQRPWAAVVHLAGRSGVVESWRRPREFYEANLLATLSVLEVARTSGARFVLFSSYMYGEPAYQPIDENHPLACHNPYAHSKFLCEELCRSYHADFGLAAVILRPFNLFGSDQPPGSLIPDIVSQAVAGTRIVVHGLHTGRDFLWVDDAARAILAVLRQPTGGLRIYNVGSGRNLSVAEVVRKVTDIVGAREIVDEGSFRPNEISNCTCDHRAITTDCGWLPETTFEEGLARVIERWRERTSIDTGGESPAPVARTPGAGR